MSSSPNREVALFSAALELKGNRRAAYLDDACADDPALRLRVATLLRLHEQALPFLGSPAGTEPPSESPSGPANPSPTMRIGSTPSEAVGERISHYKLLQQIGEGGCGVVYMAEQEEPVRRRVALKVIKLGMDTKQVIARFEAERQALALMDHPNIAKVLDAGATDNGRPYFVMELVRGIKITDYCDQKKLSTRERLDLFIQVCRAIQHAHQKGVIHRDIKPSNILVASNDGVPVPKVIDFGIAKATQGRLTDQTVFTAFEQFIGTPAYMSPEQAELTMLDIDTRTDIYSLGVLLYELLTGKTPFDPKVLLASGLDVMRRTIRESEPPRPSTRLSTMQAADLATVARTHQSEPSRLGTLLRGDLDWIVMKALEKERARRYDTANGFAMDVERYLADEPVVARPPSGVYRFQKLVRRNKLAFAAAAMVLATLLFGLGLTTWQYLEKSRAYRLTLLAEQGQERHRRQAEASEKQALALHRFLTEDLLFQATPDHSAWEKKVTMKEVLDLAIQKLDRDASIAQQPELEATLRLDIGTTYQMLGSLAEAERNLRKAFDLRRRTLGPQHLDTLAAEHKLGEFLVDELRENKETETLFREAWQGRQRLLGPEHPDTLESLEGCEIVLYETGQFQEAERIARQILPIRERLLGSNAFGTIDALRNLGGNLSGLGKHEEAERFIREALRRCHLQSGTNQEQLFLTMKEIAVQRLLQGDAQTAEKLMVDAVSQAARVFGPEHILTLGMQRLLARAFAENHKFDKAEELASATLAARRRQTSDPEGTGRTLLVLGRAMVERDKLKEATPLLQEALTLFQQHCTGKPHLAAQAANWLGTIEVSSQAYPQAATLLLLGSDQFFLPSAEMSPNERRIAVGHIVQLYQAWGRPEETAVWLKKLDQLPKTL
jgi:serine/threonine protein kinase